MSNIFNDKQKSLKRRFLLILGLITFFCFFALGVMVIFWDAILPQLEGYKRKLVGGLFIIYSILRFSRLLKRDNNE